SPKVYLNGNDITVLSDVTVNFEDPDGRQGPQPHGYWTGSITFSPLNPLPDGMHTMRYEVSDLAGNEMIEEFNFHVDTTPPTLTLPDKFVDGFSTSQTSVFLTGTTDQLATVIIRGENLTADYDGHFSTDIALEPGINDIAITSVDWWAMDAIGNLIMGNSITRTIRIIYDDIAPTIFGISDSTGSPTNKDVTIVRGFVEDYIGNSTASYPWDPATVTVTVQGIETKVYYDGSFSTPVALTEGLNTIVFEAVDEAGNSFQTSIGILNDVTPPVLTLESVPSEVETNSVQITGNVEPGANVFVNGQYVTSQDGAFSFNVTLNSGINTITIETLDNAGNSTKVLKYVA
ncbi:MAG: hypothetical protein KAI64_03250, partial [Thermoplasmata archaeon]|nr:hypothetical protein [Thermoplasmata archaeon]